MALHMGIARELDGPTFEIIHVSRSTEYPASSNIEVNILRLGQTLWQESSVTSE